MKDSNLAVEKTLLSIIIKNPNRFFEIDNNIIKSSDFSTIITECIYSTIKSILEEKNNIEIDKIILENRIYKEFPKFYEEDKEGFLYAIDSILETTSTGDLLEYAKIIVDNSIKRKSLKLLGKLERLVKKESNAKSIINILEDNISQFSTSLFKNEDLQKLGATFKKWIIERQKEIKAGKIQRGISTGFPLFDEAIGGGILPGTNNVIAARSKVGKTFLGMNLANNVASNNIPVLYLDTELNDEYENIRVCSMRTALSLHKIANLKFDTREEADLFNKAVEEQENLLIYYQGVAGWTIGQMASLIRRFYIKIVGKNPETYKYNDALVIYDYLKLMNPSDKGYDTKEWEALGYRMSMLHDLIQTYNCPMITFAQQNRDGLEKEDESTISGSDRIIYFCDSFSIFKIKGDMELMAGKEEAINNKDYKFSQCKLIVKNSRHGPGHLGREYIGLYVDFKNPNKTRNQMTGKIYEIGLELPFSIDHG